MNVSDILELFSALKLSVKCSIVDCKIFVTNVKLDILRHRSASSSVNLLMPDM